MPVSPLPGINIVANSMVSSNHSAFKTAGFDQKGKFDSMLKDLLKEVEETKVPPAPILNKPKDPSKTTVVQNIVNQIAKSENQLNELVKMGINGHNLSNQQLLTMQAGVYKATLAIDVVSKGVEQTTGGIKTLLQSQV